MQAKDMHMSIFQMRDFLTSSFWCLRFYFRHFQKNMLTFFYIDSFAKRVLIPFLRWRSYAQRERASLFHCAVMLLARLIFFFTPPAAPFTDVPVTTPSTAPIFFHSFFSIFFRACACY